MSGTKISRRAGCSDVFFGGFSPSLHESVSDVPYYVTTASNALFCKYLPFDDTYGSVNRFYGA